MEKLAQVMKKLAQVAGWVGGWMILTMMFFTNSPEPKPQDMVAQFEASALIAASVVLLLIGIVYGMNLFKGPRQ